MENTRHRANGLERHVKWPLLCALLCLVLARSAVAQPVMLYSNNLAQNYTVPGNATNIDAINFYNSANAFSYNFNSTTINQELFETQDTVNYTNVGVMVSDSGFRFDNQSSSNTGFRTMSGTFYNSHEIDAAPSSDTNDFFELGVGQCLIWASNIVNSGHITVGGDGLLQFTGKNVNLSHSVLTIQGNDQTSIFNNLNPFFFGINFFGFQNPFGIAGLTALDYGIGTDANLDWTPSISLSNNSATSSEFTTTLYPTAQMNLTNSVAYYNTDNTGVTRMIFVQNANSNVTYNVYPNEDPASAGILGAGRGTVEFISPYTDPSSGITTTNYLYLHVDYEEGNTAFIAFNNIPDDFTFATTTAPLGFTGPSTPALAPDLASDPGLVTNNNYTYTSVQFSSTTVATNSPSPNVTNYLAILPGRVEINATNELNLNGADIIGPNYISIYSPTQFDGSASAQIYAPYADINIGVTNGFLTVSNLLQSGTGRWNGTLQAWSTTWTYTDTNGLLHTYLMMMVNSQLSATTPATVNNLILHGTNTIAISDYFNIIGTFSADAQNLTLTANSPGAFTSSGGLNVETPNIDWAGSTPNLRNLTNNGTINLDNYATFGNTPPTEYYTLINNGTISDLGSSVWADNFTSSGVFSNGVNSFTLQSKTATLTGGLLAAGGDISVTTSNLFASNVVVLAGQQLAIVATNVSDGGAPSGNFWSAGGSLAVGLYVPTKPTGDLLGTTITNIAPDNEEVLNTWPGVDRGASVAGFTNNLAVGRLVLDSLGSSHPTTTRLMFNGTGASNAIYVDELVLADAATNLDSSHNVKALGGANGNGGGVNDDDNVVIYYARALINGNDVSEKLDYRNNKRLRWVPGYVGYFSSTNIVYTNIVGGMTNFSTNTVNAALAQSTDIDSDGDNIPNAQDPTPFFVPGEVNFKLTVTNKPPLTAYISWQSIPASTNYVFYATNLVSTNWQVLTNFISPSAVPPAGGWPITNTVSDVVNLLQPRYYRVRVDPNMADLYGGF